MGQEEVGNPWSAVGQTVAGEEARCGRTSEGGHERTSRGAVRGTESVQVAAVVEDRLCLTEGVGVAGLRDLKMMEWMGTLAVAGLGWEARGQSGLVEVEGLGQRRDWSPAEEVGALVCQVEGVEVQRL